MPAKLPWPAFAKDLGSSSCVVFGLARRFNMFFMCSMVPDNSWNCPSIELILVLRVDTDPNDLSSEVAEAFSA